jgi:hypothetical protein
VSDENRKGATSTTEYDAPKIEEVVTPQSLEREVQYAGFTSGAQTG